MDANQRSEVNNQTNNGANEKGTPGSTGRTGGSDQPLDHTYPGAAGDAMLGNREIDMMGSGRRDDIPGGSMETQINGGSGTVQGITDSHQRQMEQKSGAYGMLEQPVGHRPKDSGVDVSRQQGAQGGNTQGGGMPGPQGSLPPHAPTGSMGNRQSGPQGNYQSGSTQGGGMPGPESPQGNRGAQGHDGQEAQRGNTQLGVTGSHSMANQNSDFGGVHESNDAVGGLPRSPGNSGPRTTAASTDRQGSQTGADGGADVHKSNDAAGGYPRSPGYANRLAGDSNMDDDTGFKRK